MRFAPDEHVEPVGEWLQAAAGRDAHRAAHETDAAPVVAAAGREVLQRAAKDEEPIEEHVDESEDEVVVHGRPAPMTQEGGALSEKRRGALIEEGQRALSEEEWEALVEEGLL